MKYTAKDGTKFTLVEPKRRPFWYARATIDGCRFDVSTKETTIEGAQAFADKFAYSLRGDGFNLEHIARNVPRAIKPDHFLEWLAANFRLVGETVLRNDGKAVGFYGTSGGYRAARLKYEGFSKKVLEHRLKFLLAHGWMPETVDHINRDRADNRLENLRAATPAQQTANRNWGQTGGGAMKFVPKALKTLVDHKTRSRPLKAETRVRIP